VRSTLNVIQIEHGFAKAEDYSSRLALFVDGPPALAFLAGRALDTHHFGNIWVPFASGQQYFPAFDYGTPVQDDDAEADDAVAVLARYWPIGLEVSNAMAEWARCHDKIPGFESMRRTLQIVHDRVLGAHERMPAKPIAKLPCGQEIEAAHIEYIQANVEYLRELEAWIERYRDRLSKLMRRQPLLAAHQNIGGALPSAAYGYARIIDDVESTKRLFQCGHPDNVAWINKVAAHLGLGPDKPMRGPLRVRSTQRIIPLLEGVNANAGVRGHPVSGA
jgi:hypothetical protein